MKEILTSLTTQVLIGISQALAAGRLTAPFTRHALQQLCTSSDPSRIAQTLQVLNNQGMSSGHCALMFEAIEEERKSHPSVADELELVLTGFDVPENMILLGQRI